MGRKRVRHKLNRHLNILSTNDLLVVHFGVGVFGVLWQ